MKGENQQGDSFDLINNNSNNFDKKLIQILENNNDPLFQQAE